MIRKELLTYVITLHRYPFVVQLEFPNALYQESKPCHMSLSLFSLFQELKYVRGDYRPLE